ncbi:MAG: hypothetical protein KKH72_02730 [Alphaproteobacteria bacterium]|nr:hypothetical protein [Alphaproteobacteria bacterium]
MIPSSFIFTETPGTIAARRQAHALTGALVRFVVIGVGALLAYAGLEQSFVPAFPEIAAWQMRFLLAASLLVPVYQVHLRFCFSAEMPHLRTLSRYAAVQMAVVALAALFSQLAHGVVGLPHLTTVMLVFVATAGVNFSVLKVWAFSPR